jgi:large subunit ribosomal protein L29
MKKKDLSGLSLVELKKQKATISKELFEARVKNSIGQLSNPLEIRMMRRKVARLNTFIAQKSAR